MSASLATGPTLPDTGFLRQPQVLVFIPISKSTLWRRVTEGNISGAHETLATGDGLAR